jgi:hypothetical protein
MESLKPLQSTVSAGHWCSRSTPSCHGLCGSGHLFADSEADQRSAEDISGPVTRHVARADADLLNLRST